MPNIIDILARALSLRQETALNSITPNRAGGIMYDTLLVLNQMQLEGGSLLISKVYASVSAMEADTTPTSDLTGRALKPGQLVVIVTSDSSSSDMGSEYRYNGPGSWTYVGKVGGLPLDTVPTQSSTKGITSGGVYAALAAMKAEGYKYMGLATPGSGGTAPGTPNQPVFYIAGPGSYPNFGSITVASGYLGFIKYSSGSWTVESVAVGKDYDEQISTLDGQISQLEAKVDGNEFAKFNEGKLSAKLIDNSYVDKNDGSFDPYNGWKRTDYINVVPFSKLIVTASMAMTYNAYYDKDKAFIRAFSLSSGVNTITIPDNACYMALSANNATMAALDIAIGEYRLQTLKSAVDSLGTQVTGLDADKTEIVANIDFVSDNKAVNGFFKELYLIGIQYANVASINVQGAQQSGITCTFKDSDNNTLATLANDGPLGNEFISRDVSGAIMLASVNWNGLNTVKAVVNACTLTAKVGSLINNPSIVGFLSRRTASNTIPTFTKNTSYRINSSGEVVSAGSSHFYSSPIAVKGGDCVLVRTYGGTGSAVISLTDANGTFYKPIAIYTGTDPDTYFYKVKENGFVAITGYNNAYFRLTVFRDSEIAAVYDKFKEDEDALIAEMKSVPVDFRKRDSSVYVGADIDADWESVDGATKTNSIQYNNITRRKVRCATIVGPSNNGIARIRFAKSVNANLHPFLFSICIGDYSDIVNAPAGDVRLIFYSGSQSFASSRSMKIPLQTATATEEYNTVFNRNGWFCICAFLPSHEGSGVDIGESFDPTDVTGFGVHLLNSRSLPVTVHIERMDFLDVVMTKPGIVTIIDNFNTQVPAMADYAYSKGVRLNLSIIPGYYEGAPGAPTCASKEEIARLAAQGHFIWNHTWTHPNFNDITIPQIHDQINLAERWMQLNGYGEGKRIVSIPSARFNTRSCNAALDTNVEMFFHSWVRQKKQIYVPFAPVNRLLPTTWLDSDALGAGESGADIATAALKCLTYNGLAVIGFHGTYITNEGGGMENWQAYIDAIAASDAYHYGLDEILEGGWN